MSENIYDALRESHALQRRLCRELLLSRPHTQHRLTLFTDLRIELAAHAAAEERFLYIPIMMHDMGLNSSRHALHEHHEIDELVEELQGRDHSGRGWLATARKLSHQVHHHLKEEESKFFQVSGKLLKPGQKSSLSADYRADYERLRKSLRDS